MEPGQKRDLASRRTINMKATLIQINVNPNGGVPKTRVESTRLGIERVEGDKQRFLRVHGGPSRAVCLYSMEIIEALRAEGHPIESGWTGENLTIAGLDWDAMIPGVRLQIGDAAIELTSYANPCKHIAFAFADANWKRISQKEHPGWSRVYGRITFEGEVKVGDEVRVLSAET